MAYIPIGGMFSALTQELYDKLYTKEFDAESLRKDLKQGKYDADTINQAVINYVSACTDLFLEFDASWSCRGIAAEKKRESDHISDAIELLLPYGLDPNKVYREPSVVDGCVDETNIMELLSHIYDGYQAADSLNLLLGYLGNGDPFLIYEELPLMEYMNHELWESMAYMDDMNDEAFDAFVHYWMVLVSKASPIALKQNQPLPMIITPYGTDLSYLEDHRRYYWGHGYIEEAKKTELLIFENSNNLLVARFHHRYADEQEG